MRNELASRLGGRMDIDPVRLNLWLNEAYVEMCDMLDLPELWASEGFTFLEGIWVYQVGSHVRVVTKLSWNAEPASWSYGKILGKTDLVEFRRIPASHTPCAPKTWAPYGRNLIVVYPTPDEDYEVTAEFLQRPMPLEDDTDYPILMTEWCEGLLLLARAKAFSALMEFGVAAQSKTEYVSWLRSKPSALAIQQTGQTANFIPVNTEARRDRSRQRRY